ncbi:MAG: hypothetical protein BZY80_04635 [SAR202 cluster bacterium Io17-Chloro-G2]|nr:MAG: hypothetical protein BZY80_04635 [SAR202 cluster bacterium Io17-Chloro-G2]
MRVGNLAGDLKLPRRPKRVSVALAPALAVILPLSIFLAACLDAASPSPPVPSQPVSNLSQATAENPTSAGIPDATPARPPPTPHPGNTPWVIQRMDAVAILYHLTGPGEALLQSLDLRQMRGEPGFFGSYGFKKWTGVGEAKPIGVMHELGHAYWGGFPVEGLPNLDWETPPGDSVSSAMKQYHSDILSFMAQPPDGHEVLRQRLRNLPNLSEDNLEPLFHNLEADLVYSTGGGLALAPSILQKYWSRFLSPGPWESWPQAVAWYQGLNGEDRTAASHWLGFEHLDLRNHRSAAAFQGNPGIDPKSRNTISVEEQQRLFDLADQFDLLLGEPQKDENFQFWRGYLRDKLQMRRNHPGYLQSLDTPTATQLAEGLAFLATLEGLAAEEQAIMLETRLGEQPFLVNFLPALDNNVLLRLFSRQPVLPQGATLQATASFVDRLQRFGALVDLVLAGGATEPEAGGRELTAFLQRTGLEPQEDVKLFLELMRDADPPLASLVVQTLSPDTVADLMKAAPFHLRTLLTPPQLMNKLNIVETARPEEIGRGITLLLQHPSGNFRIEESFLTQMHQTVAGLAETEPGSALGIIGSTAYPLDGFIQEQPEAAVAIFSSDIRAASQMIKDSDPVLSPPARIVYRLIAADPVFAARMTAALEESGEEMVVVESLAYFAYDKARREWWPDLGISLEQDGSYLRALWQLQGGDWLGQRLSMVLNIYRQRTAAGEISPDFIPQYRATWDAAVSTFPPGPAQEELSQVFGRVAQDHGSSP